MWVDLYWKYDEEELVSKFIEHRSIQVFKMKE